MAIRILASIAALGVIAAAACVDVGSFAGGADDAGTPPPDGSSPTCTADTQTAIDDCGTCGNRCPVRANGVPECAAGACRTKCNPGFGDCDGNAANGCEAAIREDAANCGACGRNCGGSLCTDGKCAPTKLVNGQSGLYSIASDGEFVYFTSETDGGVYRCPVASCPTPQKVGPGNERAYFLAVDEKHVFWNNNSTAGQTAPGKVYRVAKTGLPVSDEIASAPHASAANPTMVSVDATNVYWSSNEGTIWRAPKDKSAGPTPVTKIVNSAPVVSVGPNLYIGSDDSDAIYVCPILGCPSPPPKLVAAAQPNVGWIATDGTTIFWTTTEGLFSFPVAGASKETKIATIAGPGKVDVAGNDLYFTEGTAGRVLTMPKAGGVVPTTLAQGVTGLSGLAVDAKFVYWVSNAEGAIYKLAR